MSQLDNLYNRFFDELNRHSIGLVQQLNNAPKISACITDFPRYNLYKVDEETHVLEFALAGYKKENISIEVDRKMLIVSGTTTEPEQKYEYTYKGITTKAFKKELMLGEHVKVQPATFEDGMLSIVLKIETPKELLPLKIDIN